MKYKIPNPRRIKFVTKNGYPIIPSSKGLILKYSGIVLIVRITRLGNTTVDTAMRTAPSDAKKIAHKTRSFR